MLFPVRLHGPIREGKVTLAFRRRKKAQARAGARHRFGAEGVLAISAVDAVDAASISTADARRAGYETLEALRRDLERHGADGALTYRIAFRFEREADPRRLLAEDAALTSDDLARIGARLAKLDASDDGPWTMQTLELIERHPHVVSTQLAAMCGRERLAFKTDVRKLKALGLTISHEVGYEVSPRGRAYLRAVRIEGDR